MSWPHCRGGGRWRRPLRERSASPARGILPLLGTNISCSITPVLRHARCPVAAGLSSLGVRGVVCAGRGSAYGAASAAHATTPRALGQQPEITAAGCRSRPRSSSGRPWDAEASHRRRGRCPLRRWHSSPSSAALGGRPHWPFVPWSGTRSSEEAGYDRYGCGYSRRGTHSCIRSTWAGDQIRDSDEWGQASEEPVPAKSLRDRSAGARQSRPRSGPRRNQKRAARSAPACTTVVFAYETGPTRSVAGADPTIPAATQAQMNATRPSDPNSV